MAVTTLRALPRQRRERGLTPVETAVSVAALALIFGVLFVFFHKSSGPKGSPISPTGDTEAQVGLWLPTDMHGLDPESASIDVRPTTRATNCGGRLLGTRVLHLAWSETATARFTIDYVVSRSAGVDSLVRHACVDSTSSALVLGRDVDTGSAVVPGGALATRDGATVTLRVAVKAPDGKRSSFEVSGDERSDTTTTTTVTPRTTPRPTTTAARTIAATRTTGPTATSASAADCVIAPGGVQTSPASVGRTTSGALVPALTVRVQTKGPCRLLTANFTGVNGASPGVTAIVLAPVVPPSTPDAEEWAATVDPKSDAWATGAYRVTILNSGRAITDAPTGTFTVTRPCTVGSFAVSRPMVLVENGGLADAVGVTASNIDAMCGALSVSIRPVDGVAKAPVSALTLTGTSTRTASLVAGMTGWSTGVYRLTLLEGGEALKPEIAVNLAVGNGAACRVEAIRVTPTRVSQAAGDGPALPLAAAVTVSVTPASPSSCGSLTATIDGPSPGVRTLILKGDTATVAAGAQPWAVGTYAVALSSASPIVGPTTASFRVTGVCTVTGVSANPATVGTSRSRLASAVAFAVTTTGTCGKVAVVVGGTSPAVTGVALKANGANGANAWAGAIGTSSSKPWLAGSYPLTVSVDGVTKPGWPTAALTVTAGCAANLSMKPAVAAIVSSSGSGDGGALISGTALALSAAPTNGCGTLSAQITGPAPGVATVGLKGSPAVGAIGSDASQRWRPGTYTATLLADGKALGGVSARFTVRSGCAVSATSLLTPASASLVTGSASTRPLKSEVRVTVVKRGVCGRLTAVVQAVGSSPAPPVASVDLSSGAATLGAAGQLWGPGSYRVSVQENGTVVNGFPMTTWTVDAGCTVSAPVPSPASVDRATGPGAARPLKAPVAFAIGAKGSCGPLTVAIDGTPAPGVASLPVDNGAATIPATGTWSAGTYVTTLREAGAPVPGLAAGTLTVKPGCTVGVPTATPASGSLVAGPAGPRVLQDPIGLSVAASGSCGGLTVAIVGPSPGVASVELDASGNASLAKNTKAWGSGTFTLTLKEGGAAVAGLGAGSFAIDPGCAIGGPPAPSIASVERIAGVSGSRVLKAAVGFDVTAKGCKDLSIGFSSGTPLDGGLALSDVGAGLIPASSKWDPGAYTATLRQGGVAVAGIAPGQFTVSDGCTVLSPAIPNPLSVALVTGSAAARALKQPVGMSVGSSGACSLSVSIRGPGPTVELGLDASGLATIAADADVWTPGQYTLTLRDAGQDVAEAPLSALTVTSGCTVVLGAPTPAATVTAQGKLTASVVVPLTATGSCGAITLEASGVAPVGVASRAVTGTGVTYTNVEVWGIGTVTLRVSENGAMVAGVAPVTFTIARAAP